MANITTCTCKRAHVRKVKHFANSIFGYGSSWEAARPGGKYIIGHGLHFNTWQAAMDYATRSQP